MVDNGSVVVAISILAVIAVVGIVAILKYKTLEEALKIWGVMTGLLGVVTGAFVTYFFTHQQVQDAQQETTQAVNREASVRREYAALAGTLQEALVALASAPGQIQWATLKDKPELSKITAFDFSERLKAFEGIGSGIPDASVDRPDDGG